MSLYEDILTIKFQFFTWEFNLLLSVIYVNKFINIIVNIVTLEH